MEGHPLNTDNPRIDYLRDKAHKLTQAPGVYLMKDKTGKIIYVGKAKILKNRVSSYFRENLNAVEKVHKMVEHVHDFDFIVTDTEFEALVLECSLIKQYNPKYNILLKDGKGYHYIQVTNEPFPRIRAARQKVGDDTFIGPFTSSFSVQQSVDEAVKVFKLPTCNRKFPQEFKKGRPCLNYHIKQCMGLCRGRVSEKEYRALIDQAISYIRNGSEDSVRNMTAEMEQAAENLDFERAALLRDRIRAVQRIGQNQKIIRDGAVNQDVIGLAHNGSAACISVLKYREGRLYDKDDVIVEEAFDHAKLRSDFLLQYYGACIADIPRQISIDGECEDFELVARYLREKSGHAVQLTIPQRGEGVQLVQMAIRNAGDHLSYVVGRTGREISALDELGRILGLPSPPLYIEAYDISNLGDTAIVGGMVVFENGRPLKAAYKRFSIKEADGQNDYGAMQEMLRRRFLRYQENPEGTDAYFLRLPDLILLDGGKGHVAVIRTLLSGMGIDVPVFGMVKDDRHRTRAIAQDGGEISINANRNAFSLVTKIQDEVHRFAISYQRNVHKKSSFEIDLKTVKGIGDKKAVKLLKTFKTKTAMKAASLEELKACAGLTQEAAQALYDFIQNNYA